ncbi:MAG TPA: MBL fold metallo-hydrolase [Candidatus Polarisedimenticolia bacterium]
MRSDIRVEKPHSLLKRVLLVLALACLAGRSWARELELDFIDVGQGDGAVLISPGGEVVLFDDGRYKACDKPLRYLRRLGIDHVDYLIVSHYHSDHIGCTKEVLKEFPLRKAAYDRGGSYPGAVYADYVKAVGALRHTGTKGQVITLDAGAPKPVTIQVTALDGNGVQTTNENDLSLDAVIHYGKFDAELGGDLSGVATADYLDIESGVAPLVGQVEVYDAHHHCSRYSTNGTWLDLTRPKVGIVSAGDGNTYQHPTAECVERLHQAGVQLYWTERGNGIEPEVGLDSVCGNIAVTVGPADNFFSLACGNARPQQFPFWGSEPVPANGAPESATSPAVQYAWSSQSRIYHYAQCADVRRIKAENLQRGETAPEGRRLHEGCPRAQHD